MPRDSSPYLRPAVVATWKAYAPLVALVPAARVYPPQRPPNVEWPFVAYGVPTSRPFLASCLDGSIIAFAGHAYAETTGEGAGTVQGEILASDIAAAMVDALGLPIDLAPYGAPWPATAHVTWTQTQVIQDGSEADRFHAIVGFEATISS